jgi:arylsulfatase A-like enzyme
MRIGWCGAVVMLCGVVGAEEGRRPNVLLILADDLGWRDTSLYGSRLYRTPNVDALGQRGVMFTQAYAAAPICSPTRASILTGVYPARLGITTPSCHLEQVVLEQSVAQRGQPYQKALQCNSVTRLKQEYVTLAEVLKGAGYATGHFGKWHLGREPYDALHQGFDVDVPHWYGPGPAGSYIAPWSFPPAMKFQGKPGEHIEDRMASEAVKFIREHKGGPFYLNYWCFSVHAPHGAKAELIEKYKKVVDPKEPQHNTLYAAMVESMDDAVGTVMKAIEEAGVADNTIVIFTSDNGGIHFQDIDGAQITSNLPLRGGKATIFEGGTREPLVVVWPGVTKGGTRSEELVSSVDLSPTILEMVGVKDERKIDGSSVIGAVKGGKSGREEVFCHFPHYTPVTGGVPASYVRKGDWKLIRFYADGEGQKDRFELYDLKEDVGEQKNVAGERPEKVAELAVVLEAWLKETHATLPRANPAYDPKAKAPPPPDRDERKKRQGKKKGGDAEAAAWRAWVAEDVGGALVP